MSAWPEAVARSGSFARPSRPPSPGAQRGLGIDPALAVLIGDPGADMPIVLDYRATERRPRVTYVASDRWREVAPDIATLLGRLGLS